MESWTKFTTGFQTIFVVLKTDYPVQESYKISFELTNGNLILLARGVIHRDLVFVLRIFLFYKFVIAFVDKRLFEGAFRALHVADFTLHRKGNHRVAMRECFSGFNTKIVL